MLRSRVLASFIPLMMVGLLAREQLAPNSEPCIAAAESSIAISRNTWQLPWQLPWQFTRQFTWQSASVPQRIGFTNDPAFATVRVQIVDDPAIADFAVVDDIDTNGVSGCEGRGPIQTVGITERPFAEQPVIYLSRDSAADYRVFVRSKSFTAQQAAALIVGAHTAPLLTVSSHAL